MSVNEKFANNRDFLNFDGDFSDKIFDSFVLSVGDNNLQGYLLAIKDLKQTISEILTRSFDDGGSIEETPSMVRTKTRMLLKHLEEFCQHSEFNKDNLISHVSKEQVQNGPI